MKISGIRLALILIALTYPSSGDESARNDAFAAEALARIEAKPSVPGDESGWFFLVRELRHLSTGRFWESDWTETAANATDPVPSMIEFHELLKERGVELILAPVPAKGRIYPEKLDNDFKANDAVSLTPFLDRLRDEGLKVVDLDALFRSERLSGSDVKLYCEQDAHYSPVAIERLADAILSESGLEGQPAESLVQLSEQTLSIVGDQVVGSEWEGRTPAETLSWRPVEGFGSPGVEPDPDSPFLLLGDSHTLVFHQGEENGMHSRGGGLLDRLSFRFGEAFDLVGVRGSGLVQARKQLYFRATSEPEFWQKKRLVVWVFSEREFTQSTDRIMSIPLDRE